jgi:hypothetical protein
MAQGRGGDRLLTDGSPKVEEAPADREIAELPKWMDSIASITTARAAVLGAGLSGANPKNLALTLAASASISEASLDRAFAGSEAARQRSRWDRCFVMKQQRRSLELPPGRLFD